MPNRMTSLAERPSEQTAMIEAGRQESETDPQRAVPEHQLEVESREEEPGEQSCCPQDANDVGSRHVAPPQDTKWYEWCANPTLDQEEDRQQHRRSDEQADRLARGPPGVVAVHDRIDGEHERSRHDDRACDVETPWGRRTLGGWQQYSGESKDDGTDWKVDQEDPVPVERVRQKAAEQHADASAAGRDEAVDAHRLGALRWLNE